MSHFYRLFAVFLILSTLLITSARADIRLNIQVIGVEDPAKTNILTKLDEMQNRLTHPLTEKTLVEFEHLAPEEIKKAMQPYGYFQAEVNSHHYFRNRRAQIVFEIKPGPIVRIRQLNFHLTGQGREDPAFQRYIKHLPLAVGQPLNIDTYEKVKQDLFDLTSERGYFLAKMISSKISLNLDTHQATISIDFDTGPRFRFGKTHFTEGPIAERHLLRYVPYNEGDYYNYAKLQKLQQDLTASNYFQQVLVNPLNNQVDENSIPIDILLTPRSSTQYVLGAGYGTDTGVRGTLGLNFRRLNSAGHHLNLVLQGSQTNSQVTANYIIPGCHPATDQFQISAGLEHISQVTGESNSGRLVGSYTMGLGQWTQVLALTYLNEKYNLIQPQRIENHAQILFPSGNWHILQADDLLRPKKGYRLSFDLAGAPDELSGDKASGFLQVRSDAKAITTFFDSTRLLVRGSAGSTVIKDLTSLPLSLQLFAGGASSIRGFDFNSIGPGRYLLVGSLEIQQKIKGDIYLGGFIDAGNVSNISAIHNLNIGVGPSLIWLSPIGSLELSVAKPVSASKDSVAFRHKRNWVVQFSMGADL